MSLHTSGDNNERVAFLRMGLGPSAGLSLVTPQPAAQQLGSSFSAGLLNVSQMGCWYAIC